MSVRHRPPVPDTCEGSSRGRDSKVDLRGHYDNTAEIPGNWSGIVADWTDMGLEDCWGLAPSCGRTGEDAFLLAKTG